MSRRLYYQQKYPNCSIHGGGDYEVRPAVRWAILVDGKADFIIVIPLCEECAKGYAQIVLKTYPSMFQYRNIV